MSDLNHFRAEEFAPAEVLESTTPVGFWGSARIKPDADTGEVEKTMRAVMDAAREEPGYELYAIYHSPDETGSYRFNERWTTGADLRRHIENPALFPYLGRFAETLDFSDAQWVRALV